MLHVATYIQLVGFVVKELWRSVVVLNAYADALGKQICAVAKCVDLEDSYDVVF